MESQRTTGDRLRLIRCALDALRRGGVIVAIPPLDDGVLPPSLDGEPYSAHDAAVGERFGSEGERALLWRLFLALRSLVVAASADNDGMSPIRWWLKGRFVTGAEDVDQIDVVLLVPNELPAHADALLHLLRAGAAREALRCDVTIVRMLDEQVFEKERRRCGRNSAEDRGLLRDAGWVEVL